MLLPPCCLPHSDKSEGGGRKRGRNPSFPPPHTHTSECSAGPGGGDELWRRACPRGGGGRKEGQKGSSIGGERGRGGNRRHGEREREPIKAFKNPGKKENGGEGRGKEQDKQKMEEEEMIAAKRGGGGSAAKE